MKLLITGASGQLGSALVRLFSATGEAVIAPGRDELDFLHPERIPNQIASQQADWVINCAAYTQVDHAEQAPGEAFLINRDSAGAVAKGVRSYGGRLLHISTDFIFDGKKSEPYREEESGAPLSVYGQTKWEGELAIRRVLSDATILRTAWVFGHQGNNFVKTMLALASEHTELKVVDDQIGTPSWTEDIARAIQVLIESEAEGIYHFTNEGVTSWYDFAVEVVETAREMGLDLAVERIEPIPSCNNPTPAVRPAYSVLSKLKIRGLLGYGIPHWRTSLRKMLARSLSS